MTYSGLTLAQADAICRLKFGAPQGTLKWVAGTQYVVSAQGWRKVS